MFALAERTLRGRRCRYLPARRRLNPLTPHLPTHDHQIAAFERKKSKGTAPRKQSGHRHEALSDLAGGISRRRPRSQNPQQWDVLSSEPGGVDYVEIDAGGIPSMWATPKSGDVYGFCLHPRRRIRVRLDLHAPKDVRPPSQSRRHTRPL